MININGLRLDSKVDRDHKGNPIEIHKLEMDFDENCFLALSVNSVLNRSGGIKRGKESPYWVDPLTGGKFFGASEMRRLTPRVDRLVDQYESAHLGHRVLGFVGNGNLLFNDWFVAWVQDNLYPYGELFCLNGENLSREYNCFSIYQGGNAEIEKIKFQGTPLRPISALTGDPLNDLRYATFGQPLVNNGEIVGIEDIAHFFGDLRHLFDFPFVDGIRIGEQYLWNNPQLLRNAATNRAVTFPLAYVKDGKTIQLAPTDPRLMGELKFRLYRKSNSPSKPGEYSINGETMTIIFHPGINPHNAIGLRKKGGQITAVSIVIRGLSNRSGTSVERLAERMVEAGVQNAILLDNGADVMMHVRTEAGMWEFAPSFDKRECLNSIILYVKKSDS